MQPLSLEFSAIWSDRGQRPWGVVFDASSYTFTPLSDFRGSAVVRDLVSFSKLTDDWDDEGALRPRIESISDAHEFIARYRPVPLPDRITPTRDGAILAEWFVGDTYFEAEFVGGGIVEWMARRSKVGPFEHWKQQIGELPAIQPDLTWPPTSTWTTASRAA